VHRYDPASKLLVCGDMNIAPDDIDVWDPFRLDGQLLCHPHEREALQRVLDWGLTDVFRDQHPFATDFSWWNYQAMGFQRNHGLRIDHIFLSASLMSGATDATIHRDVRGWDTPSDHAPVSVDLSL
jgi:exodeoxyribonuclease-3